MQGSHSHWERPSVHPHFPSSHTASPQSPLPLRPHGLDEASGTCTGPRLCTWSAACRGSPAVSGPPSSAPSGARRRRTGCGAHLERNSIHSG